MKNQDPFFLTNRFVMEADGWAHFVPKGEFPLIRKEGSVIQVVDDTALESLKNTLPAELFIDFDHLSRDVKNPTTAAGWVYGPENAKIHANGLDLLPKWSEAGLREVQGGNVRYVSPVFDPETAVYLGNDAKTGLPRYRVMSLLEAGLTNKPNMRGMRPLSNRKPVSTPSGAEKPQKGPATRAAATKENQTTMQLVNRALNLHADASEEATVGAVEALKSQRDKLTLDLANRETELGKVKTDSTKKDEEITRLTTELKNREAREIESLLDTHGIKEEPSRASWKTLLLANREVAEPQLKVFAEARKKAETPLTNRNARSPEDREEEDPSKPKVRGVARVAQALKKESEVTK